MARIRYLLLGKTKTNKRYRHANHYKQPTVIYFSNFGLMF